MSDNEKTLSIHHSCELDENKVIEYRTALYVTKDGIDKAHSIADAVQGGSFDDAGAEGICVASKDPAFSAVLVDGGTYTLKNAKLDMITEGDGSAVCDFVGLGAAVGAFVDEIRGLLLDIIT